MLTCYANAITSRPISTLSCSTSCGTSSDTTVLLRGTKPACDSFPVLDDRGGCFSVSGPSSSADLTPPEYQPTQNIHSTDVL